MGSEISGTLLQVTDRNLLFDAPQKELPIARMGTVEEIAGLALFLASSASGYCTGGIYTADGGITI